MSRLVGKTEVAQATGATITATLPAGFPEGEWTFRNFLLRLAMAPVRAVVKTVVPPVVFIGVRFGGASHWDDE